MATIKPIEARSVHQIQSGQVIVDLCSVVKELVENSLDANATAVEVSLKNNGLDAIEVKDNGDGIAPTNYENLALKHYTSKLSSYDDLGALQTFGFRGEAISSLCALSKFQIITAQLSEAPKGSKLEFETSGRLKDMSVVACQKGTTASVEGLFETLPVRRKELTKNIKREYGKVIGLLHAYACICVGVKFTVKNLMPKGKSATVFATRGNPTTKENIANVYGAKTLPALLPLELEFAFASGTSNQRFTSTDAEDDSRTKIVIRGHISRPGFGEGRQTPDRQMFFVNSRPCQLPQIAKAINEVYKTFNVSQSPFVFADLCMDTNSYDVNVSPDKRTILLHDSANLIDSLKTSLLELFERQDHTVPQSQLQNPKVPGYKQLTIQRGASSGSTGDTKSPELDGQSRNDQSQSTGSNSGEIAETTPEARSRLLDFFRDQVSTREEPGDEVPQQKSGKVPNVKEKLAQSLGLTMGEVMKIDDYEDTSDLTNDGNEEEGVDDQNTEASDQPEHAAMVKETAVDQHIRDFNARIGKQQVTRSDERLLKEHLPKEPSLTDRSLEKEKEVLIIPRHQPNMIQNAFDRMRPKRSAPEVAEITVGDKTVTTLIGSQQSKYQMVEQNGRPGNRGKRKANDMPKSSQIFGQSLRSFAAPGTHSEEEEQDTDDTKSESKLSLTENLGRDSSEVDGEDGQEDTISHRTSENSEEDVDEECEGNNSSKDDSLVAGSSVDEDGGLDDDYIGEEEGQQREEARVAELIHKAEQKFSTPTEESVKRANKILTSGQHKESTSHLMAFMNDSKNRIEEAFRHYSKQYAYPSESQPKSEKAVLWEEESAEDQLSLTVSKEDFARMHVIGQFNLGFILATRPQPADSNTTSSKRQGDELFIIDQHASDEKYNFERLQLETVVGNQRLVRPKELELTAVEEEIILDNVIALEKNGFVVDVDTSGDEPIGQRCKLMSLPLSKEVVFNLGDLEELIHLLSESPGSGAESAVPRPSKVRKMFAMRACRSSIMIGKTLSNKQMATVVQHMGEMDKPWNCPHGRPTMRHLMSLGAFETWKEGDGIVGLGEFMEDDAGTWEEFA